MAHWGWYWKIKLKHRAKELCSNLPNIDSFDLFKNNTLNLFKVPEYHLTAIPLDNCFLITYGKNKSSSYKIPFEKQTCNYGGFRYFFICPLCQKRMRKLYFTNGAFLCRKCLNLAYSTQKSRPSIRYKKMAEKYKEKIKSMGGNEHKKPPRMKKIKYETLRQCYWDYEYKYENALREELLDRYPNKQV